MGNNCGYHVVYSGTVAGAREAFFNDIPAVSVSYDWVEDIANHKGYKLTRQGKSILKKKGRRIQINDRIKNLRSLYQTWIRRTWQFAMVGAQTFMMVAYKSKQKVKNMERSYFTIFGHVRHALNW